MKARTSSEPHDSTTSAVNFSAMPDAEDEHNEAVVLNFADKSVIAHPVFPELSKAGALQRLPDATRIVQFGYTFAKEL
jgi:hypothetical protein